MKKYQRLRFLAAALLSAELVIGLGGVLTPQREIFPFASWFLFSLVPDRVVSYDLLLRGPAEKPLDPPRPFNRAGALVKSPHSVTTYQLIQQLGRAVEAKDEPKIRRLRRQIEAQFAAVSPPMRYDLVRMTYTPAQRWKNPQSPVASLSVKSFVSGEDF
jgi:hypothetical protein